MTSELLASVAGTVLSLLFSYIPKFSGWFDALDSNMKRLIMLASLLVTAGGVFGVSCLEWFAVDVTCDVAGAMKLIELFIFAAIANQAAYKLSPR